MKITKALSIKQPWLNLILSHFKDIEIRMWNTRYRGFIALHASKTFDNHGFEYISENVMKLPLKEAYITGKVLGVASIYSVIDFRDMNHFHELRDRHKCNPTWYTGKEKGFILQDVQTIAEPIELNGQLNLFNVDLDLNLVS